MATIATLDTVLRARTQKFDKDMKKSQDVVSRFSKQIKQFAVTAAAAFGATQIVSGIRNALEAFRDTADGIDKMAARTGIASGELQSLTFAIEQNGGTARDLEIGVRTMNRAIDDLSTGTGAALPHLKAMGITFEDLQGLSIAERFRLISKSLVKIKDDSKRSAAAMDLFGRNGDTIRILTRNIEQLEKSFRSMGLAIPDDQIEAAAELTDAYNTLNRGILKLTGSVFALFGSETATAIERIATAIAEVSSWIQRLNELSNQGGLDWLTPKILKPALRQWRRIEKAIKDATTGLGLGTELGNLLEALPEKEITISLDSTAESLLKSATVSGVGGGMTAEVVAPGKFFPADLVAGLDGLIAEQKTLITSLQRGGIADLPQALRQGSSAQISFLNRLNRVDEQKKANAIREKQLKEAEDAVEALEDLRTAILEGGQTGLVSIL